MSAGTSVARPFIQTSVAMLAFAGNSITCRLVGNEPIDPATFTSIRLRSGALALLSFPPPWYLAASVWLCSKSRKLPSIHNLAASGIM